MQSWACADCLLCSMTAVRWTPCRASHLEDIPFLSSVSVPKNLREDYNHYLKSCSICCLQADIPAINNWPNYKRSGKLKDNYVRIPSSLFCNYRKISIRWLCYQWLYSIYNRKANSLKPIKKVLVKLNIGNNIMKMQWICLPNYPLSVLPYTAINIEIQN